MVELLILECKLLAPSLYFDVDDNEKNSIFIYIAPLNRLGNTGAIILTSATVNSIVYLTGPTQNTDFDHFRSSDVIHFRSNDFIMGGFLPEPKSPGS
jgi:hypothetical protein